MRTGFGVRTLGIGLMFERAEVMGYCGVMGGTYESNKSAPNASVRSKATHPTRLRYRAKRCLSVRAIRQANCHGLFHRKAIP